MTDRVAAVRDWLSGLHEDLVAAIERADGAARFTSDRWERAGGEDACTEGLEGVVNFRGKLCPFFSHCPGKSWIKVFLHNEPPQF